MSSALKFNCFLFNKNPNIDPLTNKPLNEKEKELIEKGLYPETKPLNFDMDLEDKAELNNQNKSQFFAKYFKSMN